MYVEGSRSYLGPYVKKEKEILPELTGREQSLNWTTALHLMAVPTWPILFTYIIFLALLVI